MFHFLQIIFSLYSLLLYTVFRCGIYSHLRLRKISKTAIRKNQKGFRNYWLYRDIQKKYGLGSIYCLHMAYFWGWILHLAMMPLSIAFSWMKLSLFMCSCILGLLEIPAVIFASINENRAECGTGFVLLARNKETGKYHSSLIDLFAWVCSAVLVYFSYRGLL